MKYLCIFFVLLIQSTKLTGQSTKAMIVELQQQLAGKQKYDAKKYQEINKLRVLLEEEPTGQNDAHYQIYNKLYDAYKLFKFDSSFYYAIRLVEEATILKDPRLIAQSKIKLAYVLLSAGMFKETSDVIEEINFSGLVDNLDKSEYYILLGRYFFDLGDFNNDKYYTPIYLAKGLNYMDSALNLLADTSFDKFYFSGYKQLNLGDNASALKPLTQLLERKSLTSHQLAVVSSTVGFIYSLTGKTDDAIEMMVKAAIADIQSSTKETSASFTLANFFYKKGEVSIASDCIKSALEDASFYGAKQRKIKVSDILPVIEGEKLNIVEDQKRVWTLYAALATVLLISVVILTLIVFRQVRKLKLAKNALAHAHAKEQDVNQELTKLNGQLTEANKIKEEYLGYFFNVNSGFFDRIERFKKLLEKKIASRQTEGMQLLVDSIDLKKEREYLVQSFDEAFLKIFPNFPGDFNMLFNDEHKIVLKEGELLNTDLRIFALIRLGIDDNEKIAGILQYSVRTINAYKSKIKNRSFVKNDEFEDRIMAIRST